MSKPPTVEDTNQSLSLNLTPSEIEMLQWLAQKADLNSPSKLLEAFAADLTGSWRNGGSDERWYAFDWFKRHFGASVEEYPLAHEAALWRNEQDQSIETSWS